MIDRPAGSYIEDGRGNLRRITEDVAPAQIKTDIKEEEEENG